ncbi:MAG: hypothetical protein HIU89_17740 [Proteobacteria bacterium]|nr:hypothetical protein [Pseudomonadota bacterium]
MLFEALDLVQPETDLLVLDRGYPSNALAPALTQIQRHFCWRVDATDWACVRKFLRSGQADALVSLASPSAADTVIKSLLQDISKIKQPNMILWLQII